MNSVISELFTDLIESNEWHMDDASPFYLYCKLESPGLALDLFLEQEKSKSVEVITFSCPLPLKFKISKKERRRARKFICILNAHTILGHFILEESGCIIFKVGVLISDSMTAAYLQEEVARIEMYIESVCCDVVSISEQVFGPRKKRMSLGVAEALYSWDYLET